MRASKCIYFSHPLPHIRNSPHTQPKQNPLIADLGDALDNMELDQHFPCSLKAPSQYNDRLRIVLNQAIYRFEPNKKTPGAAMKCLWKLQTGKYKHIRHGWISE